MADEASARERWNERRSSPGAFEPFPDTPAEWLVEHGPLLGGGGRALDVACGDGRNALYLAGLGFEVDAVDVSDVTIDALRAAAAKRGLTVHPRVVDLERESPARAAYDVVVCFNYLQRDLFAALEQALRPGGRLLFETFARAHIDELGRTMNPAFVLADNELLHAFGGLRVRHYREGIAERGGAPRGVASLLAQRPAA
ncbi:MAG: tellurite methyltransferase [Solirubrobacteraceae bacterium]|jgi:2-polyprenyl-3-methyl-5-hydroxy-6-metoxy-1,4-benzoquinol methylase|nr:tellurite methyltransferase [Solirubrobacteraceae bacterium]